MGMKACCSNLVQPTPDWKRTVGFPEGATDMTRVTVFVGLDYHQDSVQVCVMDREGLVLANRRCANSSRTIRAVVHRYGRHVRAAIEACSGAAELAEELVSRGAWSLPPW